MLGPTQQVAGRTATTLDGPVLPDAPALLCDGRGLVVAANAGAAELARVERAEDLVGRTLDDLLVGDAAWHRLRCGDGDELPVRVVRLPAPDAPGPDMQTVVLVDVSDLVDQVAELTDERRRLREVQQVAGIGSWEHDPRTGTTVWSEAHYTLLGLRPGTVVPGMPALLDVVHPHDREMVAKYWQDHQVSGTPVDIEYRIVRPDGEPRRIRSGGTVRRGEDGRVERVTGYIRDITEQWRADAELAVERGRLLEAQRIAKVGSWTYEPRTGVVHRSAVLMEMYAEAGVVPGDDLLAGVRDEDQARLKAMHEQVLRTRSVEPVETEVSSWDGRRVYVCRARAQLSETGQVECLHGTIQDVTQARALERQLRDDRRRLADAQRAARLGTWEWDPQTDRLAWSEMLLGLYGLPPDAPRTYQTYLGLVHPDDRAWVDAVWRQLVETGEPVECEHRLVRTDGSVRVFRCHGMVAADQEGRSLVVGTAQDITEQRATETRMERSSQRFTDLVAVTPVGIGLFDEAERLIDANDALCDLLGMDLHQLRGMTAEQLTHPEDNADRLRSVARMNNGTDRVYKVPQRLLVRSDGELVYCELHIAISVQDDGRRFWLVVFQDVTERRRTAEALRHQATHDELTGLPNRAAVKEMLGELLKGEDAAKVAVLFCDIDNFKRVNDSLGHDAGDELLVALARRLEGGLPTGCTAARLSGDEYVIICADIEAAGGVDALANRVASLLRTVVPVHGQLVRVSASIGAAMPNGTRTTGNDLLRFADAAMFEAKRGGAGRVHLASAALIASADRQVHLEGQLRDALAKDGLALHFQPVVGVDGAVLTAEALVRWPHPDRGLLPPDVFLPVAEQGDLLRELDRWVLRTALREAATWTVPDGRRVAVAVNLSGLVPGDPDFADAVASAVAEAGIEWDRVVLELVETALVDLPSRTRQAMGELVERGVRFAVDDFGTGYSSLARLKDLPAQIIKVDRRFVAGVGNNSSDFAVARAVVDMARAMGRSCVAEGVETATQFHVLRGVGVDAYQGWLFSRPVPPKEFRSVLALGSLHVPRAG
ncbi:sensor domain-containing protein [Goodfellowiella coeruleoviolacea]|uniref:sensor domain-containing protein n=1 Tax=Goodfellowiella coeruleoviolacea TaxID=334858 RepID=UPI0020A4F073|nr:EAL domain-containing protein [Goodfellowiella coeruleoviolacea]